MTKLESRNMTPSTVTTKGLSTNRFPSNASLPTSQSQKTSNDPNNKKRRILSNNQIIARLLFLLAFIGMVNMLLGPLGIGKEIATGGWKGGDFLTNDLLRGLSSSEKNLLDKKEDVMISPKTGKKTLSDLKNRVSWKKGDPLTNNLLVKSRDIPIKDSRSKHNSHRGMPKRRDRPQIRSRSKKDRKRHERIKPERRKPERMRGDKYNDRNGDDGDDNDGDDNGKYDDDE